MGFPGSDLVVTFAELREQCSMIMVTQTVMNTVMKYHADEVLFFKVLRSYCRKLLANIV